MKIFEKDRKKILEKLMESQRDIFFVFKVLKWIFGKKNSKLVINKTQQKFQMKKISKLNI